MSKKQITKDMLTRLYEANEGCRGTRDWTKYVMIIEYKEKNRWRFMNNYGVPQPHQFEGAVYKRYKDYEYIVIGDTRYTLTKQVKMFLGIM